MLKLTTKLLCAISLLILATSVAQAFAKQDYRYEYVDRDHTFQEKKNLVGSLYLISLAVYPLTQWDTFKDDGSFRNYKNNLGKIVFDKDETIWNWIIHPYAGSQLFLFYRANGFSRINSLAMSFISSALFEFTIEIYTEPASVQDLYQTPILGALIGIGLEEASLALLNLNNPIAKVVGHILNPSTLFWFYEGKVMISPTVDNKKRPGLFLTAEF